MRTTRPLLIFLLMLVALFVVVMNWSCVIVSSRNSRKGIDRHHSTVPLFSLLLAAIAVPVFPFTPRYWIWFIPLDPADRGAMVDPAWDLPAGPARGAALSSGVSDERAPGGSCRRSGSRPRAGGDGSAGPRSADSFSRG
jgi:hypothetical protein